MALFEHAAAVAQCPFLEPKQTWAGRLPMSPFDPKRTSVVGRGDASTFNIALQTEIYTRF
jgi:hypothetical protein